MTDTLKPRRMVTVTIQSYQQTGVDSFKDTSFSRNFATSRTLDDILKWAESMGVKNPTINSVTLSDFTGDSI